MLNVILAKGDGIGPEISESLLSIFNARQVPINFEEIKIGEQLYLSGHTSGIDEAAWDAINRNTIMLKAPITTPRGKGYKSINVTLRKSLGLYANVRPVSSWHPILQGKKQTDVIIFRENEEDLYAGIEHRQTAEVTQCLKLITRTGCERIIRYAFEYANAHGRKKVTCMAKENIMKITDGLFVTVFNEIKEEYPEIHSESQIIDIGSAKIAAYPELYDVIVTPNLYGDIVSDIAAEVSGCVGISPSYNVGNNFTMYEAIHGSAPDIAGKGIANPSAFLLSGIHMLSHNGLVEEAQDIQNAWVKTIEEGQTTGDMGGSLNTKQFTDAIISNLGKAPQNEFKIKSQKIIIPKLEGKGRIEVKKELVGVDIFVDSVGHIDCISAKLLQMAGEFKLQMVTNRGVTVYPRFNESTSCADHWRCRFQKTDGRLATPKEIVGLISRIVDYGLDVIKTENLYNFDGVAGYSLGQGQ